MEGDNTDQLSAVEQRHCEEAGRLHAGGEVAGEWPVGHRIPATTADCLEEGCRQAGAHEWTCPERVCEVGLLVHRIQDAARFGVDQKHVGEAIFLENATKQRVEGRMHLRVGRLVVSRVEQKLGADGVFVVSDIEVLEVCGCIVESLGVWLGHRIASRSLPVVRGKFADVIRVEFPTGSGYRLVVGGVVGKNGGEGGLELLAGIDRHAVLGKHPNFIVQRQKIAFDRLGGNRADGLQLCERLGSQRVRRRSIGGNPHQCQRDQRDGQQRQQQPVAEQRTPASNGRAPCAVKGRGVNVIRCHAGLPVVGETAHAVGRVAVRSAADRENRRACRHRRIRR